MQERLWFKGSVWQVTSSRVRWDDQFHLCVCFQHRDRTGLCVASCSNHMNQQQQESMWMMWLWYKTMSTERVINSTAAVFLLHRLLDSPLAAAGRWCSPCGKVSWWTDACPTRSAEAQAPTPWNSSSARWCSCGDAWSQSESYPGPSTRTWESEEV